MNAENPYQPPLPEPEPEANRKAPSEAFESLRSGMIAGLLLFAFGASVVSFHTVLTGVVSWLTTLLYIAFFIGFSILVVARLFHFFRTLDR